VMPPRPSKAFEESEFVPGFSMLVSTEMLARVKFDSSIRMYGEDLEFQIRLGSFGRIGCSSHLGLDHKSSPINRESARSISRYTDGFRWRLHKQFPTRVWGPMVIFSSLVLFVGNLIDAAIKWSPERLASALGHWDFLRSWSQRLPMEQQVGPWSG
jgi:GT2 family glycosyltransferase